MTLLRAFPQLATHQDSPFWMLSGTFYHVRRIWKAQDLTQHLLNPHNAVSNLIGGSFFLFLGDNRHVQNFARTAQIVTGIFDVLEQRIHVQEAWIKLQDSRKNIMAINPRTTLIKNNNVSSFLIIQKFEASKRTIFRIMIISQDFFKLGKEVFILSMRIMDVFDCIFMDRHSKRELANEGFIKLPLNVYRCIFEYAKHKNHILEFIDGQKDNMESAFKMLGIDPTYAHNVLNDTHDFLDFVQPYIEKGLRVGAKISDCVSDGLKEYIYRLTPEGWSNFLDDYEKHFGDKSIKPLEVISRIQPKIRSKSAMQAKKLHEIIIKDLKIEKNLPMYKNAPTIHSILNKSSKRKHIGIGAMQKVCG